MQTIELINYALRDATDSKACRECGRPINGIFYDLCHGGEEYPVHPNCVEHSRMRPAPNKPPSGTLPAVERRARELIRVLQAEGLKRGEIAGIGAYLSRRPLERLHDPALSESELLRWVAGRAPTDQ